MFDSLDEQSKPDFSPALKLLAICAAGMGISFGLCAVGMDADPTLSILAVLGMFCFVLSVFGLTGSLFWLLFLILEAAYRRLQR